MERISKEHDDERRRLEVTLQGNPISIRLAMNASYRELQSKKHAKSKNYKGAKIKDDAKEPRKS